MKRWNRMKRVGLSQRRDLLQLWHEQGAGREELLPLLEKLLLEKGCRVLRDDGWRGYDLRIRCGRWLLSDLLTVTEYREDGATLTRVRITARPTQLAVALAAGGGAVLGAVTVGWGPVESMLLTMGVWVIASVAAMLAEMLRARGLVKRTIERAGSAIGASVISLPEQPGPGAAGKGV